MPLFTYNLEHFGRMGGFEKLLEYLGSNHPFENLVKLMEVFNKMRGYLHDDFYKGYSRRIMTTLKSFHLHMSEEDIKIRSKKDFSEIINTIDVLPLSLVVVSDLSPTCSVCSSTWNEP